MNYFELYYTYLAQCEKENWANMRDPNHDYMEWNHTLPQCIFGNQPIGQWLTKEQHAIASALQTLAFRHQCHCGWHRDHMPANLWNLSESVILGRRQSVGSLNGKLYGKFNLTQEGRHRGIETQKNNKQNFFDPDFHTFERQSEAGKAGGATSRDKGVGIFSFTAEEKLRICSDGGKVGGKSGLNSDPDYLRERGRKAGLKTGNTRARCTITGFESNVSGLTRYQLRRGINPSNRIILN